MASRQSSRLLRLQYLLRHDLGAAAPLGLREASTLTANLASWMAKCGKELKGLEPFKALGWKTQDVSV